MKKFIYTITTEDFEIRGQLEAADKQAAKMQALHLHFSAGVTISDIKIAELYND